MAKRALVTGIAGQDGSYLAEQLLADGMHVTGMVRPGAGGGTHPNLDRVRGDVTLLEGDLLDGSTLADVVREARPDELYHLAAPTFVPASWDDAAQALVAIAGATATLLTTACGLDPMPRVYVASSSEVFGDAGESPQDEDSPMRPRSPYGVAKLSALGLARVMRAGKGLPVSTGITFNHESPRRPGHFLPRKVTRAAAAIALGRQEEVVLGDLDAVRDWSDARDIARGARLAVRYHTPGDYVFAGGIGRTVRELVEVAFAHAGVDPEGRVRTDQALVRPPEATPPVGDPSRARRDLGWRPEITFEQTIGEMVDADLALLGSAPGHHRP